VTVLCADDPASDKPGNEPHPEIENRATVALAPLERLARETYRVK
jgi:hypothetical protein